MQREKKPNHTNPSEFGAFLRHLREDAGFTIDKLSELAKINKHYLERMESEEFATLPPQVYVRGFIIRLGKFLGEDNAQSLLRLYSAQEHQKFERETLNGSPCGRSPVGGSPAGRQFGPTHIAFAISAIFAFAVIAFLMAHFTPFLFEPDIEILSPAAENAVVNFPNFTVEGRARFSSELTLNGDSLYIGKKGLFTKEIELLEGVNRIVLRARNVFGREVEVVRRVVYIKSQ